MTELIKFDPVEEMPNFIKVIGVGGGGSNAVTHMFTEGIQGVDFILCNTDYQALEKSPVAMKVHLGKRALGAGNIPAVGREAAMETKDEIRDMLSKDTKMAFITAGMGGGTGTGAAPVVAEIARELDILTVGIVTMPFTCEGKRRQQQAMEGIAELRKHVDTLLVISNDKLRDEYGNMKLTQAFKKADDVLKTAAKGIAEIITVTGYVNVDFQDVNTVMRRSGKAIMGSGFAEGQGRAERAVEEAVHSPLLDDSDIRGAKNILIYITSGSGDCEVSLDEVMEITDYVQDATGNCSDVIWGNGIDESLGEGLNVTLIATGFDMPAGYDNNSYDANTRIIHEAFGQLSGQKSTTPEPKAEPIAPQEESGICAINKNADTPRQAPEPDDMANSNSKRIHTLGEEKKEKEEPIVAENDNNDGYVVRRREPSPERRTADPVPKTRVFDNPFSKEDDEEDFGIKTFVRDSADTQVQTMKKHDVATGQRSQKLSQEEQLRRERLASLNMNFRSMSYIEELENQPAYMRKGLNIKSKEEQELSSYSSNKSRGISENNSYLHDNVD